MGIVKEIANTSEDYEFYPTTTEIINSVVSDINKHFNGANSFLDIGAGDGRVLSAILKSKKPSHLASEFSSSLFFGDYQTHKRPVELMAIEKSRKLVDVLPAEIFPIGNDFFNMTLMSIDATVTFSNPPYSIYVQWVMKVLSETRSKAVYLVIPISWENNKHISDKIEERNATVTELGRFSFKDAERKANIETALLRIELPHDDDQKNQPLHKWVKENILYSESFEQANEKQPISSLLSSQSSGKGALVNGSDYISSLLELYQQQSTKLLEDFRAVNSLSKAAIDALNLNVINVSRRMNDAINSLKQEFWHELFSRLDSIYMNLPSNRAHGFKSLLMKRTVADFSEENIRNLLSWIHNSITLFDSEMFEDVIGGFMNGVNTQCYKSNKSTFIDANWRYNADKNKNTQYMLKTKRVVYSEITLSEGINEDGKLLSSLFSVIQDMLVMANNRGYDTSKSFDTLNQHVWASGKSLELCYYNAELDEDEILFSVKAFKKANLHFHFNERFINEINVEWGRLKGWVSSAKQASDEMGIDIEECIKLFDKQVSHRIQNNPILIG
ncbi:TPA: DUF4942 domain-containing protein [Vibrio vulnificus]|uniref:DUF4942 domain-containing protein n=1 Tax=Vibrio vulnificus TaxID=672 RepID=A0A8H9K5B8_VIBVL|nr:DUF4942 domain-containing protein [Vibrio vulnificus]HAS8538330.1 DUF4942 domain-containing protein [Vibrio vulnificus]